MNIRKQINFAKYNEYGNEKKFEIIVGERITK